MLRSPSGSRTLIVALGLAIGLTTACGSDLPNPENELPTGFLDSPAGGMVVPQHFRVAGWALDNARVVRIDIYVDGRYSASTTLSVRRPDVLKAFPQYARSSEICGWEVNIDFGGTPGPRVVLAQAVDDSGATRDIGAAAITVSK